jgi:hypothetical protein
LKAGVDVRSEKIQNVVFAVVDHLIERQHLGHVQFRNRHSRTVCDPAQPGCKEKESAPFPERSPM